MTAYIGLTPSKYYRIPLIIDLDKLCPKHMAFIGANGNGKTVAAYAVAEEALLSNIPVLVLDITGQWTSFLEPCTDPVFLTLYKEFNITARSFPGRVYIPGSNVGLPVSANLLAKPKTNDFLSELRAYAKELSELLKEFCNLNAGEIEDAKSTIFESWKNGKDLDYKSLVAKSEDAKAKKKLEDLAIVKFLFEGSLANISDMWKKGEISVVAANFAKTAEIRMISLYYILRQLVDYFDSLGTTDREEEKLRLLLVVEVTLLDDKRVMRILDRIARTTRKRGLGLLLVTQRLMDLGDIQTNINTKAYLRTVHKADLDRAAVELGEIANTLTTLKTGSGIFFSPDYTGTSKPASTLI
jgi:DNA helicase HerA-like ATPase